MELVFTHQDARQVSVTCNNEPSHTFDLHTLLPNDRQQPPHPLDDAVAYGKAVYSALFPLETPTRRQLENEPDRIVLVTSDNDLDAVAWEYAYGPSDAANSASSESFLVLQCHFVRGLPAGQQIPVPALEDSPHIIAIPSNPLSHTLKPLDIEDEWLRLREALEDKTLQGYAITLERTRPPTLERLGLLVTGRQQRIVHFMGHGDQDQKQGALLCFEKDNGDLDEVTARDFTRQVGGTVFLVTLNACASATPGETQLSNLAAALVRQKTPYALGMRFSIPDDDALTFARTFYNYLVRGASVEEAIYRVRLALARNKLRPWMVGMPVLYTALSAPAAGFPSITGTPEIEEHQPHIEASALPRAEGTFQGRTDELKALGDALTGDMRPRLFTVHGFAGQGKTALAREAVERFAYAWPGGVWAAALENPPTRDVFVNDLARFLGITSDPREGLSQLERQVLSELGRRRTLIVLDNAETLADAAQAHDASTLSLAEFLKQLPGPTVSLLATSRVLLGWPEEASFELGGLSPEEGAALFRQSAPQRPEAVDLDMAKQLSQRVDGHPLSLRLLGGAFNAITITLAAFVDVYDTQLVKAENTYVGEQHRQRTLYASIDTSVRYLDEDHRQLLSGLWLFHAPFMPEAAEQIFDPPHKHAKTGKQAAEHLSPIFNRLYTLWRRGLLLRETLTVREGTQQFYRLPPAIRVYIEQFLAQASKRKALLARFGAAYARLVDYLRYELDRGGTAGVIALLLREDLDQGATYVKGAQQGYYWLHWGWILQRLGYRKSGLELTERALALGQEQDQALALLALNNMALVYQQMGRQQEALTLYEQALPLLRASGDRAGEAAILHNMAQVYQQMGEPEKALKFYEQVLPLVRAAGNRAAEATVLNSTAEVYRERGDLQEALRLYEQALPMMREESDRAGEAVTLHNMALVYKRLKRFPEALELSKQALALFQELGDPAGEALVMIGMAGVYRQTGEFQEALQLYEHAWPILREVGDAPKVMSLLDGLASVYQSMHLYAEAQRAFEQSVKLAEFIKNPAAQAAGLANLAKLLYLHLIRRPEAIVNMEQALTVLGATDLPQDAAGRTREQLAHYLDAMRQGISLGHALPAEQVQQAIFNTVAVMTLAQDQHAVWRENVVEQLQYAQQAGEDEQLDVDFLSAILDILDGKSPTLPPDHPYAQAIASIQEGIAADGPKAANVSDEVMQAVNEFFHAKNWEATRHVVETRQEVLFRPEVETLFEQSIAEAQASGDQDSSLWLNLHLTILRTCKSLGIAAAFERVEAAQQAADQLTDLPIDAELITRSINALKGGPQEKMQHSQYLAEKSTQASDEGLKALINTIQLALFSHSLTGLGKELEGVYRQAWNAIVTGVE